VEGEAVANPARKAFLRNEDWWACILGWFIILVGLVGQAVVSLPDDLRAKLDAHDAKIATLEGDLSAKKEAGDAEASKVLARQVQEAKAKKVKEEEKYRKKEGIVPQLPKVGSWSGLSEIYESGWIGGLLLVFILTALLTWIAGLFLRFDRKLYVPGFLVIFALAILADIVASQKWIETELQFETVFFALIFGLIISNVFRVPGFLAAGRQTEFFVKIGLVVMGAGILFGDVLRAGLYGLIQALVVATAVWFMTYFICRRFRVSERFSAIIATANSICGVSATIAAGGAIQGKPKEVSYMVAWVLVCAVVLIFVMPPIAVGLGLSPAWAGPGWEASSTTPGPSSRPANRSRPGTGTRGPTWP
jgi:hypothetical protein